MQNIYSAELKFWLQIMGDHAHFIKSSLNPEQQNSVLVADNFIRIFDKLLGKIKTSEDEKELNSLLSDANAAVLSLRDFKRELLSARLKNLPVTALTPTFLNHMLNELEDFLKVLMELEIGHPDGENIIGQHLLWSLDASGHAAMIGNDLDKVEYRLRERAKDFETIFGQLYLKAVEIAGYFRSHPPSAEPALAVFNREMAGEMKKFMEFLEELKTGIIKQQVLGRLSPLQPDHMWREGSYYLHKIADQNFQD
jgi:hypothetical protein